MLTTNKYSNIVSRLNWTTSHFLNDRSVWLYDLHQTRFIRIINEIEPYINSNEEITRILDIGCFPGTFATILKQYFGDKIDMEGAGLGLVAEYRNEPNIKSSYTNLHEIEFDPENLQNRKPHITTSLSASRTNYYDIIIAGEVIEHLYSPIHFIKECHTYLKSHGRLVITTNNVSYFGSICRLLMGRTNHEDLKSSHIFMKNDWRPHIRIYDRYEIKFLLEMGGFKEEKVILMDNKEDLRCKLSFPVKLKMLIIRMFYIIPYFRNQYIGLFEKLPDANSH